MSTTAQATHTATVFDGACYPPFRMSIDQYEKLIASGVFTKRDKLRTYGASGVPVYWIVNLRESQVEVYTEPTADGYGRVRAYKPGEVVPVVLDSAEVGRIAVSDILS